MNGKIYVVACCGTVSEYDTQEEVNESLTNSLSVEGDYGFLPEKVFDHYPTEAEFDAYMKEAKEYEAAYDEKCRVMRESHEAKGNLQGRDLPVEGGASYEYGVGTVPEATEGEVVEQEVSLRE